jgi:phosphate transport system protein
MDAEHPQHTNRAYEDELQRLHTLLLQMGELVEHQITDAVHSLVDRDSELARRTISRDAEVNQLDIDLDELTIRVLALRQPAAIDLRLITTSSKIATDLERIGDIAVNVAERALELNYQPVLKPYIDIPRMAELATGMVKDSLRAFVSRDPKLAAQVIARDDDVDLLNYQIYRELLSYMSEEPTTIRRATGILFVSKYLERIADHATNIAELVIFLVEGRNIKHLDKSKQRRTLING